MKLNVAKTKIQYLVAKRNGYLVLALGSIFTNIILTIGLLSAFNKEKVILVPPAIERPMWVTHEKVSSEYLEGMSIYLTYLLLNVTPSNAPLQHKEFLKVVDSQFYQHIKTNLILEEERLTHDHMTISFHMSGIKSDAEHLMTHINGDVEYKMGESSLPTQHLTYALKWSYQAGFLKLQSFEEIKNDK